MLISIPLGTRLAIQIKQQMEIFIFYVQQKKNQMNIFAVISWHISIISPYILDITDNNGGLMVFVKSQIPSRRLNDLKTPSNVKMIPFEINFRKEKWLVVSFCSCSCSSQSLKYTNPKINLTQTSCGKHIGIKNIPYSRRKGTSLSILNVKAQKYGINSSNI